jgi:hypothetical protein
LTSTAEIPDFCTSWYLFYRDVNGDVRWQLLNADQAKILSLAQDAFTLPELCERLLAQSSGSESEIASQVGSLLVNFIDRFQAFDPSPTLPQIYTSPRSCTH